MIAYGCGGRVEQGSGPSGTGVGASGGGEATSPFTAIARPGAATWGADAGSLAPVDANVWPSAENDVAIGTWLLPTTVDAQTEASAPPDSPPVPDSGAGSTCPGYVHVAVGSMIANYDFDAAAACAADVGGAAAAVGYFVTGSRQLVLAGCTNSGTPSQGIRIVVSGVTGIGSYSTNAVSFVDRNSVSWNYSGTLPSTSLGWTTHITTLDPVGGIVEGTYIGEVTSGGNVDYLMGHFTVCHVQDTSRP